MSNLLLAQQLATALARFMFPDTSDNRAKYATRTAGDITEAEQYANIMRKLKGGELQKLRASAQYKKAQNDRTKEAISDYGNLVYSNSSTVGNCFENAAVGAWYLNSQLQCTEWTLVWHEEFDHVYLVIGIIDETHMSQPHSLWPDDVAIYDGWGQIACKAQDFSAKWSAKMSEWGTTTANNVPSRNAVFIPGEALGFVNPTVWRNAASSRKDLYLK